MKRRLLNLLTALSLFPALPAPLGAAPLVPRSTLHPAWSNGRHARDATHTGAGPVTITAL